ncbi:hypothetical protein PM082_005902 [Marasmius tenuissimus]|nr:hypothetical protein PM082_005902 [Marasmius tenuissimus]
MNKDTKAVAPASQIAGTASEFTKAYTAKILNTDQQPEATFGYFVMSRMRICEVSLLNNAEEPKRQEMRVVYGIRVEKDMVNEMGNLHGGCSSYLVDMCSGYSISAHIVQTTGKPEQQQHVSQAINTVYHSPAQVGDELRIVNTTVSIGKRALTARTEIWNDTHHRLVVSGTQIAMFPSPMPTKSKI